MENEEPTMSEQSQAIPFVKSIFHPSDFSEASELAFAHALAIALIGETQLVIMHARRGEREPGPGPRREDVQEHPPLQEAERLHAPA